MAIRERTSSLGQISLNSITKEADHDSSAFEFNLNMIVVTKLKASKETLPLFSQWHYLTNIKLA